MTASIMELYQKELRDLLNPLNKVKDASKLFRFEATTREIKCMEDLD